MTKETRHEVASGSEKLVSRRQFLISGSLASAGLVGAPQVLGDTVGNERIITKRQQGEVHTTRKVPKKWRKHALRSRRAYWNLVDSLDKKYSDLEFRRRRADSTIQGLNKFYIEISVPSSKPELASEMPDQIDNIPVETSEQMEYVAAAGSNESYGCYNDEERQSVPGGSPCHINAYSGPIWGMMGFAASVNGNYGYMMTASHVVHENGCNNGHTMRYYDNRIGGVHSYDPVADWALVSLDYSDVYNISGDIVNTADNSMWYVDSYFTQSGLEYCMANNTTLHKQGRVHGNVTGQIESLNWSGSAECIDMGGHGVGSRIWCSKGESGGPVYQQYDGSYATVANVVSLCAANNYFDADCNGVDEYKWSVGWPMYMVQGTNGIDIGAPRDSA